MRSMPRRFFKRPFPPPSPAKHINAMLAKRLGRGKPKEGTIPEEGATGPGGGGDSADGSAKAERQLDMRFGFGKNFVAKYELGKEVRSGHFGHTCSTVIKKGNYKGHTVAIKIISKAKIHMAKCSAPSPRTWPEGWCEPIKNQKKEFKKFRP